MSFLITVLSVPTETVIVVEKVKPLADLIRETEGEVEFYQREIENHNFEEPTVDSGVYSAWVMRAFQLEEQRDYYADKLSELRSR
jgi:hypothetical protein